MPTKSRSSRPGGFKSTPNGTTDAKPAAKRSTKPKAKATVKPAAKTQASVTRKYDRGKFDPATGDLLVAEPTTEAGGVRYEDRESNAKGRPVSNHYLPQVDDVKLGHPESITMLVTAGG